ncbi:IS3 family transposase [Microbacterium sp. YY-01]|uniref:IS3 family transposase n=1 Tax=Microbacterium sp. YY-01 TaxID=3421634 RepID=UPI003D179C81
MIERTKADFPVAYLCERFQVSESGFYAWRGRSPSVSSRRRSVLLAKVLGAFIGSGRAAGHRKITATLAADHGLVVNRKTVLKAMRGMGLMPPAAQAAFRRAAQRARVVSDPPDLVDRRFQITVPGTVLVGDITYVPTAQGWLHVATVIDLATRMVLGYACGKRQTVDLVVTALQRAIRTGVVTAGAIFHSDHGTQYRSKRFSRFCGQHAIRRSMGAKFECWDNAVAESFFAKLKNERLRWLTFTTRQAAAWEVRDYINNFNHKRRHQSLGYATPAETMARLTAPTNPAPA